MKSELIKKEKRIAQNIMDYIESELLSFPYVTITVKRRGDVGNLEIKAEKTQRFNKNNKEIVDV